MLASETSHYHLNLRESCFRPLLPRDHGSISGLILFVIFLPVRKAKALVVTVCYLSKYVVVRSLKSKRLMKLSRIRDIYLDVGVPDIIQHDHGKEFISNVCLIKDAILI